jgi:hypothetical protein
MATRPVTIPLREAPTYVLELSVKELVCCAWAMGIATDRKSLEEIRARVEAWPLTGTRVPV